MGYQRPTLKLIFDDPEFEGLEARSLRFSIDDVVLLSSFGDKPDAETLEAVKELLASRLLSWNFEDHNGAPVEITPKAIGANVDPALLYAIVRGIRQAVGGKSGPLETPSPSGEPTLEAGIPMDVS